MGSAESILLTGCRGQLGSDLMQVLSASHSVTGVDIEDLDIRNSDALSALVRATHPDVIVHAAAYTDVDGCESNRNLAFDINGEGTRNVAAACRQVGARLIYYSTDYVFDGLKSAAYTEEDIPNPMTVYGQSKLAGEKAVSGNLEQYLIMRIAWAYGLCGRNFVRTMLQLGRKQIQASEEGRQVEPLRVVDDQRGNPSWTSEIARQTAVILDSRLQGVVHASAEGETTWHELARDIFTFMNMPVRVEPCNTAELSRPAPRPHNSSLENRQLKAAGLNVMRNYRLALEEFLGKHGKEMLS